jgi:hypothetical protein
MLLINQGETLKKYKKGTKEESGGSTMKSQYISFSSLKLTVSSLRGYEKVHFFVSNKGNYFSRYQRSFTDHYWHINCGIFDLQKSDAGCYRSFQLPFSGNVDYL